MKRSAGLYFHYPFCAKKCPYCDYNTHVREHIDADAWRDAYLTELNYYAESAPDLSIQSVFFGGGTPSLLPPATVAALLEETARLWPLAPSCEITLEANPTSSEAAQFAGYKAAGVNRVSLGIQALDDAALRFLGRTHTVGDAEKAISLAARLFSRWSLDLMYGRPKQTLEGWDIELRRALNSGAQHLALYQLTIEDNTAFARAYAKSAFKMPDEDTCLQFFDATEAACAAHGLQHYEVSSFAVRGEECRHNLGYWQMQDYIGIGAGAHGRLHLGAQRYALETVKNPETWLKQVQAQRYGHTGFTPLSRRERIEEAVLLGLRLADGLDAVRWMDVFDTLPQADVSAAGLQQAKEQGLLIADEKGIRTTPQGLRVLNHVERLLLLPL